MIYNADCLASNQDILEERIDGVQFRHRYRKRLLELKRQIVDMVLPPNKTLRTKQRRVPEDVSENESDQDRQGSRKSRTGGLPEKLLRMIEAIGCEDVMTTWSEAIAEEKSGVRSADWSNGLTSDRSKIRCFYVLGNGFSQ